MFADYIQTTRRATSCPYCGNAKIVKNGKQNGKQRYRCKECSKQFNDTGALGKLHASTEQVGTAIRMYYGGNSYQQTAETMADTFDISEPSKETLYRWVTDYTDHAHDIMADYPAHTSGKWVADETQIKVGGKQFWLWNVMDAGTRYALAVHLSPNRDTRAAVAVMRKAMAAADASPKSITTDKLGSYDGAIKQVLPDAEHIKSEGIKARVNDNLSERLQGTIKDRSKTFRGLDGLESGQRYFDGWAINYNLFREHEGVDHQTPAEMAGVNPPFLELEDVVTNAALKGRRQREPLAPTLSDAADRAERASPRIVPDSQQRRRPKGETDSDDDEEWPRTDSDTVQMSRVQRQLREAVQDANLPPRKASAILDSIKLPKRRQSPYGGKAAKVQPPAKAQKRKGDDTATPARKPVLVLGR